MALGATQGGIPSPPEDGASEVGAAAVVVAGASLAVGDPEPSFPDSSRSRCLRSALRAALPWSGSVPGLSAFLSAVLFAVLLRALSDFVAAAVGLEDGEAASLAVADGLVAPVVLVGPEPDGPGLSGPVEPDWALSGWGEGFLVGFGVGLGDGEGDDAWTAGATPGADLVALPFQDMATDPPSGTLSASTPWLEYVQLPDFPSDHHKPQYASVGGVFTHGSSAGTGLPSTRHTNPG
jgi:hypothetical protein